MVIAALLIATLLPLSPTESDLPALSDRLRAVKLDDGGEITLVERRGDALRVAFTLVPTPKSFIRCELGLPPPE